MKQSISIITLTLASFVCFSQNTYYVSPNGNDSNTGLAITASWRTLQYAVDQLSAGDILYMRGGSYYEDRVNITVNGTATDPILIKAYPGELPVLDNRIPEFLNSDNNSEWQVYDPVVNVYESTQVFPDGWKAYGFLEELGEYYHLVTYKSYAALSAATEDWTASGETYVGPGVFFNDSTGRIYIKLDRPSEAAVFQAFTSPINNDPRQNIIHLGLKHRGLLFRDNTEHIIIDGLTIHSFEECIRVYSGSNLTFKNMSIWAGQYGLLLFDTAGANYLIDSVDFNMHLPDWVARADMKTPPSPASNIKLTAMVARGSNVEISHCNFYGTHDAIVSSRANDLVFPYNYMETQDDATQIGTDVYNVEFSYNMVIGAGPSHQGTPALNPFIGADYYHHNIIDFSTPIFFARNDPDSLLKPKYRNNPLKGGGIFGVHGKSHAANPDPWKIYNNTLIGRSRVSVSDHKFDNWIQGNVGVTHEFYNNIAILVDDWFFYRGSYVEEGEEIFDHNIYHRLTEADMEFRRRLNEDPNLNYATLDEFLSSPEFVASQSYYPPGWDANSRVGDPLLDSNYYPDPNGIAATGALDLSDRGWPGADGAPYIGALPPPIAEPVIEGCPSTINIMANNIGCTGIVTWTEPTLFGNSIGISMTSSYSSGDTFPLGTTTVTYAATNGTITDSCSFNIVVTSDIEVVFDSLNNVICEGAENGAAYISVLGGTTGYTYDWDNDGAGDFDDDQNQINLDVGTYTVQVKDANGCIATDSFTLTEPTAITAIITETICAGDILVINGVTYSSSVTGATEVFNIPPDNCDSTVTINLTVAAMIDTTITETGNVLTTNEIGAQYQWIDCFNGNEIVGETNSSYTATISGTYAVVITKEGCSATSTCVSMEIVGISDNPLRTVFLIYPNPTENKFTIEFEETENIRVSITNIIGKEIYSSTCSCIGKNRLEISVTNYSNGLYFVKLESNGIQKTIKLIKQ